MELGCAEGVVAYIAIACTVMSSKVRNCGGLKEEDELELSVMDDSKRQQIVDDSIRRIRRYVLLTDAMALMSLHEPIRIR